MQGIKKSFVLAVLISLFLFVQFVCAASERQAPQVEAKLQQVALFKNGLGFFLSEVACPDRKDSFTFVPAAAPSHGTFWVAYPPKVKLDSLIARETESSEAKEAVTIPELLKANVGRKVGLFFSDEQIVGVIKHFAEDRVAIKPNPYAPGGVGEITVNYRRVDSERARLVIIETEQGQEGIDPHVVKKIEFLDGNLEKTFTSKTKSMQLDVKLAAPARGKKLTISYLAKGVTWAPSYIVDISEGDKALISAKAAVINEACDLDDVTIQLVTGFPHLQFADIVSPLAMKENLAQFLQSLIRGESERGRARGVRANVMMQSAEFAVSDSVSGPMPEYGAAKAGTVAEDLFFYPVENIHLARGEVGYLPLFSESVPYKHIYQWKIPDYVSEEDIYSYRPRREQEREREEEVWHCLRMENTGKVPWTTAPAETIKEGLILGQDTLNYTPVKGETTLRITRAVSVKAEQMEIETERKRDAARLYGYHYDLVTVEGKLSVTNFQAKAITLEITKTLSGEVKSSQPEAESVKQAVGLRRMNSVVRLTWTIELQPGVSKQLDYLYDVYVRR